MLDEASIIYERRAEAGQKTRLDIYRANLAIRPAAMFDVAWEISFSQKSAGSSPIRHPAASPELASRVPFPTSC
jgi:hypothetical protein